MVRIKACVAGGCSGRNGVRSSLHRFPFDRPKILRQWVKFVHQTRKNWSGPTKCSMLCSLHFTEDSFPFKYRFLESCGETVTRKYLLADAVPTKQLSKTPKPGSETPMCSTPKKPRRAFLKREVQRILMSYEESAVNSSQQRPRVSESPQQRPGVSESPQQGPGVSASPQQGPGVSESPQQGPGASESPQQGSGVSESPQQGPGVSESTQQGPGVSESPQQDPVYLELPKQEPGHSDPQIHPEVQAVQEVVSRQVTPKETRTVGSKRSLSKPPRRSDNTQRKRKNRVKGRNTVRTRDVAVGCNLLTAEDELSDEEDEGQDPNSTFHYFLSVKTEDSTLLDNGYSEENHTDMKRKLESIDFEMDDDVSLDSSGESDSNYGEEKFVENEHRCEICECIFDSDRQLNLHMETHSEYAPSEESDGGDSDFEIDESDTDTEKTPRKGKKCKKCHNYFFDLDRHMEKMHMTVKCTQCEKVFDQQRIKAHVLRVHSNRRARFTCDVCEKSYTTKHQLKIHKEVKHENHVYICEECGQGFPSEVNLKGHKRKHLEKDHRDIVCDVCGKRISFRNKTRHMRTHTKTQAFKCTVCGRGFNEKEQLDKHSRTHTGEKPYKCETCSKTFNHKVSLKAHMKKCHL